MTNSIAKAYRPWVFQAAKKRKEGRGKALIDHYIDCLADSLIGDNKIESQEYRKLLRGARDVFKNE